MTQTSKGPWPVAWACFLGFLVLLTLGIRFAEPVRDGDLYWQMAYGRYLIENRTLIPDHAAFTWTPASNARIYCAWISETFLYLLHAVGGLPALFAFRYVCLLTFVVALILSARALGVATHPMTWLICLLGLLMSQSAAFIKPEIFSYVFMTITVLTWWRIRSSGEAGWRLCYLLPLLMLLWVNSHGGFIFGAAFLFVMGVGEALNILFSPSESLAPRVRRHLFAGLFLSAFAVFLTPYGWRYPAYLIQSHLLGESTTGFKAIRAYTSVLSDRASIYHYVDYLFMGVLILIALIWQKPKRHRLDWALILTNLSFAFLYTRFLRTTYFWVPIFSFSTLHLLSNKVGWLWPQRRAVQLVMGGVISVVCILLGARASFDAICKPYGGRWFGFGISYINPVEEATFIRTNLSGYRLGNDYTGGGYLLWALWPDTKVMIDPRQFPFREWFNDYRGFSTGRTVGDFVQRHPCDVWCIRFEHERVVDWFLRSPDWHLTFYGPVAAVFVGKGIHLYSEPPRVGPETFEIRNIGQALRVLLFTTSIRDWASSRRILTGMRERFKCPNHRSKIQAASDFQEGVFAYFRRDYEKAIKYLEACRRGEGIGGEALLAKCYDQLTILAWSARDDWRALRAARAALALNPSDPYALFNVGALEWYLSENSRTSSWPSGVRTAPGVSPFGRRPEWRPYLQAFVKRAEMSGYIKGPLVGIAREILKGTYHQRPPLASPAEPPLLPHEKDPSG